MGTGKTEQVIGEVGALLAADPAVRVAVFVPDHALAQEMAERLRRRLGPQYPVAVWRGQEQPDPAAPGESMCRRVAEVRELRKLGGEVTDLCGSRKRGYCPFHPMNLFGAATCGYRGQWAEVRAARVVVLTHASLQHAPPEPMRRRIDQGDGRKARSPACRPGRGGRVLLAGDARWLRAKGSGCAVARPGSGALRRGSGSGSGAARFGRRTRPGGRGRPHACRHGGGRRRIPVPGSAGGGRADGRRRPARPRLRLPAQAGRGGGAQGTRSHRRWGGGRGGRGDRPRRGRPQQPPRAGRGTAAARCGGAPVAPLRARGAPRRSGRRRAGALDPLAGGHPPVLARGAARRGAPRRHHGPRPRAGMAAAPGSAAGAPGGRPLHARHADIGPERRPHDAGGGEEQGRQRAAGRAQQRSARSSA